MNKLMFTLVSTCLILLQACNNNNDEPTPEPPPPPTKKELIIGSWNFTKIEGTVDGMTREVPQDVCSKDNLLIFEEKNIFKADEGTSVCTGSPQTETGTWFMNDEETQVLSIQDEDLTILDIVELSDSLMVVTSMEDLDNDNDEDDTIKLTLTKKK